MTLDEQIPIITRTKNFRDSEWDNALKPVTGCLISRHGLSEAPQLASAPTILPLKAGMGNINLMAFREEVSRENVNNQVFTWLCHKAINIITECKKKKKKHCYVLNVSPNPQIHMLKP